MPKSTILAFLQGNKLFKLVLLPVNMQSYLPQQKRYVCVCNFFSCVSFLFRPARVASFWCLVTLPWSISRRGRGRNKQFNILPSLQKHIFFIPKASCKHLSLLVTMWCKACVISELTALWAFTWYKYWNAAPLFTWALNSTRLTSYVDSIISMPTESLLNIILRWIICLFMLCWSIHPHHPSSRPMLVSGSWFKCHTRSQRATQGNKKICEVFHISFSVQTNPSGTVYKEKTTQSVCV